MKHYKITIENGGYPLSYECGTIADAYGCIDTMHTRLFPAWHEIDMDEVMELLVNMRQGNTQRRAAFGWSVEAREDEA